MNIKRHTQFLLDKEKDSPDAKLRYRIKWDGSIVAFNVGFRIDISKWSTETQRCKNATTHSKKKISSNIINKEITRFEQAADETFLHFEKQKTVPDESAFRNKFNAIIHPQKKQTNNIENFFDVFDNFVKETGARNEWAERTYLRFNVIKNHLKSFNPNLTTTITDDFLQEFIKYLQLKKLKNSTIEKAITSVKWILRWAAIKGIYNGKSHETFKPKFKKVESKEIIYLTWDELIKLYQFKFKKNQNYLEKVRDVFCFCCFTGLRHSDVYKLTRSDVSNEHISVVTQKTSDTLKIEFNNFSKAILNKYENELMPDNKALPVISNQKTNDYLKEIGSLLEFNDSVRMVYFIGSVRHEKVYKKWELLTSHCGRRTFVVNALSLGIPAEVIIKWTGHSDYKSMKPYISIVDTLKRKEMNKFNLVPSL